MRQFPTPAAAPWATGPRAPQRRPAPPEARLLVPARLLFACVGLLHPDDTSLTPQVDDIERLKYGCLARSPRRQAFAATDLAVWLPARPVGASARTRHASNAALTLAAVRVLRTPVARLRGARHATLAVLATPSTRFHDSRLCCHRHEVVLLPLVTAGALRHVRQARSPRRLCRWAALGVCPWPVACRRNTGWRLLSIAAPGTLIGADLQFHRGTAFLPPSIAAAMAAPRLRDRWTRVRPSLLWPAFASIQLPLLLVGRPTSPHGPAALQRRHRRCSDSAALAEVVAGPARRRLGGPIGVVVGPGRLSAVGTDGSAGPPGVLRGVARRHRR